MNITIAESNVSFCVQPGDRLKLSGGDVATVVSVVDGNTFFVLPYRWYHRLFDAVFWFFCED